MSPILPRILLDKRPDEGLADLLRRGKLVLPDAYAVRSLPDTALELAASRFPLLWPSDPTASPPRAKNALRASDVDGPQ